MTEPNTCGYSGKAGSKNLLAKNPFLMATGEYQVGRQYDDRVEFTIINPYPGPIVAFHVLMIWDGDRTNADGSKASVHIDMVPRGGINDLEHNLNQKLGIKITSRSGIGQSISSTTQEMINYIEKQTGIKPGWALSLFRGDTTDAQDMHRLEELLDNLASSADFIDFPPMMIDPLKRAITEAAKHKKGTDSGNYIELMPQISDKMMRHAGELGIVTPEIPPPPLQELVIHHSAGHMQSVQRMHYDEENNLEARSINTNIANPDPNSPIAGIRLHFSSPTDRARKASRGSSRGYSWLSLELLFREGIYDKWEQEFRELDRKLSEEKLYPFFTSRRDEGVEKDFAEGIGMAKISPFNIARAGEPDLDEAKKDFLETVGRIESIGILSANEACNEALFRQVRSLVEVMNEELLDASPEQQERILRDATNSSLHALGRPLTRKRTGSTQVSGKETQQGR